MGCNTAIGEKTLHINSHKRGFILLLNRPVQQRRHPNPLKMSRNNVDLFMVLKLHDRHFSDRAEQSSCSKAAATQHRTREISCYLPAATTKLSLHPSVILFLFTEFSLAVKSNPMFIYDESVCFLSCCWYVT